MSGPNFERKLKDMHAFAFIKGKAYPFAVNLYFFLRIAAQMVPIRKCDATHA